MKALRIGLYVMPATLAVVLALAGALWVWSGSERSLNSALEQLATWLPADQTLEAKDVTGSLRTGGHIGWLRWRRANLSADISVELHDVNIAWSLRPLLGGELRLGRVTAQHLRIEDRSPPKTEERQPPPDLRLPVRVDIPFTVETAEWIGAASVQASALAGHYVFDSYSHKLYGGQMRISSGTYRIEGSVQALSPMALTMQVDGAVQTPLPSSPKPLQLRTKAQVQGTLAGRDATLALQADLAPEPTSERPEGRKPQPVMQAHPNAHLSARIQPWQVQPVVQATAHWQQLNLAALWPQAPQTQLHGQATVQPQGKGWQAGIQLSNTRSGPWNQQQLPLEKLDAQVAYGQGQWNLQSLQGTLAGGRVQAQGRVVGIAPPQWQGSATVYGIHPDALDSRLGSAALDGQLSAQQGPSGITFDAQLHATPSHKAARPQKGLRWQAFHAQGVWNSPLLKLNALNVQTDDAQLQGQLTWHTLSKAAQGQLTLRLPGAQAKLEGNLTRSTGQGAWDLHIADAALASRWFQRLPGVPDLLDNRLLQGQAEFSGHWAGGWQNQGQALQLQAQLRIPRLDLLTSEQPAAEPGQAWHVRDAVADLAGTLREPTLSIQGQMETGTQQFKLQAQAKGEQLNEGVWEAQLSTAQLSVQNTHQPGTWTLRLNDSVAFHWTHSASTRTLQASAGAIRLSGPVPGSAVLRWQPSQWSQHGTQGQARSQWRTQGNITDLPLAWLDLLGKNRMAPLGLRGDLVLAGQWDASSDATLKLRATLERIRGDLLLQTDGGGTALQAGVREARITLATEGKQLNASLRWDSERAGQAQAQFSTRIQLQDGSWTWPADAPLAGSVQAQLPPLGIWSVLAPPGWRLHGTLAADVLLSGTRRAPQWRGTLAAQELAVRSVVDGIDLRHGTLRALLAGQRLDLQEFSLHGASGSNGGNGSDGGLLSVTGSVLWLPTGLKQELRMDLEATAQALRLSTRADRRLVVSGKLFAQLREAQLAIRGLLKADQALWVLPPESAPQLGGDVVVHQPDATGAQHQTGIASQAVRPDIAVILDLGPDFQVRGRGIDTRLAGKLDLQSTGRGAAPRLTGTLHTEQGRYEAYGQNLDIEQGLLRFAGPYNNPALDILAIRPNLQQRVGVQVSGTAQAPVVRLYAQPDLPEAEKLAWLVLGRSGAAGGAETAMLQQAALSLLGGKGKGLSGGLAQALGLDELALRTNRAEGAQAIDGSTHASVLLGKRLSRDFYLAYERGLTGTLGTLSIFYDLSSRFAVRAQTGEQSAVDLIFTLPYD